MQFLSRVTIVLPTHERHPYLLRALEFYRDTSCKVIVVDSSAEPISKSALSDNVDYLHFPNMEPFKKIKKALATVKTPYTQFMADDDFIFPGTLQDAVCFLDEHHDYASVQGGHIDFNASNLDAQTSYSIIHKFAIGMDISQEKPFHRLLALNSRYMNNFYALQRTSVWNSLFASYDSFSASVKQQLVGPMFEWFQASNCVLTGKHKILCKPWLLREVVMGSEGSGELNYELFDFHKMRPLYLQLTDKFIENFESIPGEEAYNAVAQSLDTFVEFSKRVASGKVEFSDSDVKLLFSSSDEVATFKTMQQLVDKYRVPTVNHALNKVGLDHYCEYLYGKNWICSVNHKIERLIEKNHSIILYGAGEHSRFLLQHTRVADVITGVTDSDPDKIGTDFDKWTCMSVEEAIDTCSSFLISSKSSEDKIINSLHSKYGNTINIERLYGA